jgi:general secretion pathway protein H
MRKQAGYTFIELTVVMFLIGMMLFLAAPRIRSTLLDDGLESAVRHLVGIARELRNESVREQLDYILHIDLNGGMIWTYAADMTPEKRAERQEGAFKLPVNVRITDVSRIGQEKQKDGEATITFFRKGYVQPAVVHLAREDRFYTIVFQPFLNAVKTYDRYLDFRDHEHMPAPADGMR